MTDLDKFYTGWMYGWPIKKCRDGSRGPDAPKAVRFIMHLFFLAVFNIVKANWQNEPTRSLRYRLWLFAVEGFGWWGYSHRDEYN